MDYELGVNKAGRPYRLYPADPGREFRAEFLTMPPVGESKASLAALCREAGLPEAVKLRAEEILAQVFARGATTGYSRGLAKRNEVLGRLDSEGTISRKDLCDAAQLSVSQGQNILRGERILREQRIPASERRRPAGKSKGSGPPKPIFPKGWKTRRK